MLELGRQRGAQEVIAGASAKEISERFCNHETPLRDSTAWLGISDSNRRIRARAN
jgi:hypothetical protein